MPIHRTRRMLSLIDHETALASRACKISMKGQGSTSCHAFVPEGIQIEDLTQLPRLESQLTPLAELGTLPIFLTSRTQGMLMMIADDPTARKGAMYPPTCAVEYIMAVM